jgi:hypothetical protein
MNEKLIEVDTIYAQMSEFSDRSFRPHPWVMGFSYSNEGAVSVWWDHAYESTKYQLAKFDLVDWMHENDFIADTMVNLVPLPEEKNLISARSNDYLETTRWRSEDLRTGRAIH